MLETTYAPDTLYYSHNITWSIDYSEMSHQSNDIFNEKKYFLQLQVSNLG